MSGELITLTHKALTRATAKSPLDGRDGENRCRTRKNQLGDDIDDDISAVFAWIRNRAVSDKTKRVFLSEIRRLYYWLLKDKQQPLSSLGLKDLEDYREFLKAPPTDWIGPKAPYLNSDTGLVNPEWRPFEKPMNDAHVRHVFAVLKSLFKYLTDMGYLDGNPLVGLRTSAKTQMGDDSARVRRVTERALDRDQWDSERTSWCASFTTSAPGSAKSPSTEWSTLSRSGGPPAVTRRRGHGAWLAKVGNTKRSASIRSCSRQFNDTGST